MTWLMGPSLDCQSCDAHSAESLSDPSCEIVTKRIPVTSDESGANCLARSRENSSGVIWRYSELSVIWPVSWLRPLESRWIQVVCLTPALSGRRSRSAEAVCSAALTFHLGYPLLKPLEFD